MGLLRVRSQLSSTTANQISGPAPSFRNDAGSKVSNMSGSPPADVPSALRDDLTKFFRLLSDETRLRLILFLLREGELHVSDLCERLGHSQPAVSHHLAMLRLGELIRVRRDGKFNYYALSDRRLILLLRQMFSNAPSERPELRFGGLCLRQYSPGAP